ELAVDRAHVGGVEVHVADEVRRVPVLALPDDVGHRADRHQGARRVEASPVVEREATALHHLVVEIGDPRGVGELLQNTGHGASCAEARRPDYRRSAERPSKCPGRSSRRARLAPTCREIVLPGDAGPRTPGTFWDAARRTGVLLVPGLF